MSSPPRAVAPARFPMVFLPARCHDAIVATLNRLTFTAARFDDYGVSRLRLTPCVDGVSLASLVREFEDGRGFDPAGGYTGIVPGGFYGDLRSYFLGTQDNQWPEPEHLWLLACECGEPGCWPLAARVIARAETVTWTDFANEHRDWDYTGFGPFVFARDQYEQAVDWAASRAESEAG